MALGDVQAAGTSVLDTDHGKFVSKGVSRFAVSIKKSILHTPVSKAKSASARKPVQHKSEDNSKTLPASEMKAERRSKRLANKPSSNLSVEQQATALLFKKCGIIEATRMPTAAEQGRFHTQFVEHLDGEVVLGMRNTFGLPEGGAADSLSPLLIDAEA